MRLDTLVPAAGLAAFLLSPTALAQDACAPGTATARLDATDVSAPLRADGRLLWDGADAHYQVPRGGGVDAIFAASLWVGGQVGGELRAAAQTYGQTGAEFWPGPLADDGAPPSDCAPFDRIWVVSQADLDAYDAGSAATPDLAEWPADLGAPVQDGDGVAGNYDLAAGDRPALAGSAQTAWWVMNDAGGEHGFTGTAPIGLEARVQAFVYAAGGDVPAYAEQASFFEATLVYRGPGTFEQAYASLWADGDLGYFADDCIGSAPELGMAFLYNGDDDDESFSDFEGYGADPPALGIVGVEATQQPLGDLVPARSFFGPDAGPVGGPSPLSGVTDARLDSFGHPTDFGRPVYNVQRGRTLGGTRLRYGFGVDPDGPTTGFFYPGAPPAFWSELDLSAEPGLQSASPGDRRLAPNFGPFDLATGDAAQIRFGILWARAPGGGALGSLAALRADALDLIGGATRDPEAVSTGLLDPLGAQVPAGQAAEVPVPYTSEGNAPLELRFEPGPDPLSQAVLQPATFVVEPHSSGTVRVTADAGDLPPGEYAMTMIKRTSDRNQPVAVLPVTLTVLPPLSGEASPDGPLHLLPPAPNPTRGAARLRYRTDRPGTVRLSLVDALGREVLRLVHRDAAPGEHTAEIDTSALPAGVYAVRVEQGGERAAHRLTVLR